MFAAIPINGETAKALLPLMQGLDGTRWTPEAQLHLTLRFAGELAGDGVERLRAALAQVRSAPVRIELADVGRFELGDGRAAIWAGVRPDAGLRRLQDKCEAAARSTGIAPDEREWLPHVTLGYTTTAPTDWLHRHGGLQIEPAEAPGFGLYESVRTGGAAEYRVVQFYDFSA